MEAKARETKLKMLVSKHEIKKQINIWRKNIKNRGQAPISRKVNIFYRTYHSYRIEQPIIGKRIVKNYHYRNFFYLISHSQYAPPKPYLSRQNTIKEGDNNLNVGVSLIALVYIMTKIIKC